MHTIWWERFYTERRNNQQTQGRNGHIVKSQKQEYGNIVVDMTGKITQMKFFFLEKTTRKEDWN